MSSFGESDENWLIETLLSSLQRQMTKKLNEFHFPVDEETHLSVPLCGYVAWRQNPRTIIIIKAISFWLQNRTFDLIASQEKSEFNTFSVSMFAHLVRSNYTDWRRQRCRCERSTYTRSERNAPIFSLHIVWPNSERARVSILLCFRFKFFPHSEFSFSWSQLACRYSCQLKRKIMCVCVAIVPPFSIVFAYVWFE